MLIRWVHPKQVEQDTGKLKPTAFPVKQLENLHTKNAPSVIMKKLIDNSNIDKAKLMCCNFCECRLNKVEKKNSQWKDVKWCKNKDKECDISLYGVRAAMAFQKAVEEYSFLLDVDSHSLAIVEAVSVANPGHALIQSLPPLEQSLPDDICMDLQLYLIDTFNQIGTVDQALDI